ncbi:MAG: hypothetical protein KAS66_02795 [Candidatus Omnitrophica bacterium]|nr:hypothetical protein [Candidatus Omnitrophota bacterium]
MNKLNMALIAIALLVGSIASAALISQYLQDERDLEVSPWLTYEINTGPTDIYGGTNPIDYYNLTSTRGTSVLAEIHTDIYFNGELLDELYDTEGIDIIYFMSNSEGELWSAVDTNNNGFPDVTIWGTGNNDGITTIKRRILTRTDLVPGTYTLKTQIVPRAV